MKSKTMTQCAKDLGIDLTQKNIENSPDYKCLFKCMFEKDGVLKNGVLLEEEIIKFVKECPETNAAEKEKITKAVPKCLDETKTQADLCDKSFNFAICVYKNSM